MPFGDNNWLALTQEPTIEPELQICDPHHHNWDLRTDRVPYHRYLLHELIDDIHCGHNVRSTVFVEAGAMYRADGPEEMRSVGEVEFVQGLAAASASGLYGSSRIGAGIVGRANLNLGDRVEPVLEALLAASPNRFRGIRHSVTWHPHPAFASVGRSNTKGQLESSIYRTGARVLSRMGLSLEAWLYFPQLPELAEFAKAVPDLTIILNHIGGLLGVGPYANRRDEVLTHWRRGIAVVAECSNISVKLGGMGMPHVGFDWHTREIPIGSEELAESMSPYMHYCIETFGPDRCMFESNFPVDKVSFSYNVMYNAFKRLSSGYSVSERAALFHDTAARVYRLDV
ncbi:MAG: amidohydrolase family protein [Candidatus Poribacteria bacterium]|nr:amidohydrolase family protein [Candidatus Poribacteria bacterium]MDE0506866.1 amidohydrolase family protein [Candidatus Poribacteria bacterium]